MSTEPRCEWLGDCKGHAPAAPVAQEPPAPTECTCVCIAPGQSGGYNGALPSEWEQADDCPVHPLSAPGGAQEPADPRWLTGAIAAAMVTTDAGADAVRAALPILRSGIEREVREAIAADLNEQSQARVVGVSHEVYLLALRDAAKLIRAES